MFVFKILKWGSLSSRGNLGIFWPKRFKATLGDLRSQSRPIKFNIKNDSIIFAKQILKNRRKREEELTCRYQESLTFFFLNDYVIP